MTARPFSRIAQIAYVVDDLEGAIDAWSAKFGIGPFFVRPHIVFQTSLYRNRPSDIDISCAFAFAGDVQIELLQQHNDAPSVFRDFFLRHGPGLQHVGVLSQDIEADTRDLTDRGVELLQVGLNAAGVRTRLFDTEFHPGAMLELIENNATVQASFAHMRAAAEGWDGADSRR